MFESFSDCSVVNWENAEDVKAAGEVLISAQDDNIEVDLGCLQQANSVSVAVISAWYRAARLQDKSIVFVNLSQELRNIIALTGLDDVLTIEST